MSFFGCFSYPLLANARVRSSQEGGNHETFYSKGGVKKMLGLRCLMFILSRNQGHYEEWSRMKHEELNKYPLPSREHATGQWWHTQCFFFDEGGFN
jgi:hypothetical protein